VIYLRGVGVCGRLTSFMYERTVNIMVLMYANKCVIKYE